MLIESLDRLSREQISDALKVFLSIIDEGIIIFILIDNVEYTKENINENMTHIHIKKQSI